MSKANFSSTTNSSYPKLSHNLFHLSIAFQGLRQWVYLDVEGNTDNRGVR